MTRRLAAACAAKRTAAADPVEVLVELALVDETSRTKTSARDDAPYCSVGKPGSAKLAGTAYVWGEPRANDRVYRVEQGYLADVGATCARVRVAVDASVLRAPVTADAAPSRGARPRAWIPKAGPVFWPSGKKAGIYKGKGDRLLRVTERDDLICVDVRGVAEEVCHRRADVTVENGSVTATASAPHARQ